MTRALQIVLLTTTLLSGVALSVYPEETLPPVEYAAWVADESNGLKVRRPAGDHQLALQYKPLEYLVVLEQKSQRLARERVARRIAELEDLQYFTLTLAERDPVRSASETSSERPVHYFAFGMQADLALRDGGETLPCRLFHFEQSRPQPPFTFVLGFPLSERQKQGDREPRDKTLIYDARRLGGPPAVELTVRARSIAALPKLRTH